MKKLFLIPLMAMLCTVMAWGSEIVVNNFNDLKTALSSEGTADVVKLGQDIAYATNGSDLLNIQRSLTLDGQGHKITGWGTCNSNHGGTAYYVLTPLAINYGEEASNLDVTLKNLTTSTVSNTAKKHEVGLTVMDKVAKLTIKDCDIRSHTVSGAANSHGIAFYGETSDALVLNVENSFVSAGASGYGFSVLKPIDANLLNSTLEGYSSVTFYAPNSYMYATYKTAMAFGMNNSGSRGTTFYAKSCDFNAPNIHSGVSNAYATFAIQDDGIDMTLDNCGIDATQIGDQQQWGIMLSPWTPTARRSQNVNIEFTGDNSHINGILLYVRWLEAQWDKTVLSPEFDKESWAYWGENGISLADVDHSATRAFSYTGNINVTISGGTYAQNVGELQFPMHVNTSHPSYDSKKFLDADYSATQPEKFIMKDVEIASGYEVQEVKQGDVTLYRVVKKAQEKAPGVMYDLNDFVPVEGEGYGDNPVSSFDLSTGDDMTLNQEVTTAGYVQIKDHATEGATTVIVDKTAGGDEQRLIINNGLDVQGESSVEVKPGAAIVIGEGGINTEKPENIVIESTEEAQGALLLDPTITVNQNPKLTVKLKTNSKLNQKVTPTRWEYTYQRFAIPVMLATAGYVTNDFNPATHEYFDDEEEKAGFESYVWQWTGSKWENTTWNTLKSSIGYQLANNSKNGKVTYTFTGNLIGNTNTDYEFDMKGFKFFGNSYTAPIMIEELLNGFKATYPDVEATVWVYNYDNHGWKPVDLDAITDGFDDVPTTIKSMDGFILNLRLANSGVAGVDYASAIWNNPAINPKASASPAPRRSSASAISNSVVVKVSAANFADDVTLVEREDRDLSFENGADASKFMNESGLNIYAETPAGTLSRVATNDLLGTQITFDAVNDEVYTLSFSHVRGGSYALRDNITGKVIDLIEGETYTFTQAANTSVQNRFEIVASHKMPTAVDNIEASAKAKGIYTILGQYMGETSKWNSLPAGVYVVDGVKVVK